ncbi:MAG: type I methionyl aminopeptidase [Actinomycetota bacterium]|nr:type I methionyl aminopeptidase [Actinomycetota bacterium]
MIVLKSRDEIDKMKKAGRLVAEVLESVAQMVKVGLTTLELDHFAEAFIRERGGVPAFKGYKPSFTNAGPFPATLCVSINDEVVHGIPSNRPLLEGDLLSIDTGAKLDGYFGDAAISIIVGSPRDELEVALVDVTRRALKAGIEKCVPGNHLSDISHAVQATCESEGFSVVRKFVGHGIGREMHEDPPIPNFGKPGKGPILKAGMVFAIEPMVNAGGYEVVSSPNEWVVRTSDGSLSAHFEHTVAVTEGAPEVLTLRSEKI